MLSILAVVTLIAASPVAAAPGFAFLRLGEGARDAALGEASVALSSYTADAANPAALATGQQAVTFSHTEWIEQIRHEYVGALFHRGDDVVAVSARLSHSDDLERRTGATLEPEGKFGVYEWTAGAAWSRQLATHLRAGAGIRFVRQSIFDEAASGAHADVGLLYETAGWNIGAAVRNVGTTTNLDQAATDLPLQMRLGAARRQGPMLLAAAGHMTDGELDLHAGVEWQAVDRLLLRDGYDSGDTRGLSYGAGFEMAPWRLDYAYLPFGDGLGPAHRFSLRWAIDTVPSR